MEKEHSTQPSVIDCPLCVCGGVCVRSPVCRLYIQIVIRDTYEQTQVTMVSTHGLPVITINKALSMDCWSNLQSPRALEVHGEYR